MTTFDDPGDAPRLELAFDPRRPPSVPLNSLGSRHDGVGDDAPPQPGPPGDPRTMSGGLRRALRPLFEGPRVEIVQEKEWGEILTGWETRNRYRARALDGATIVEAEEQGEGVLASLSRNLNPFRRIEFDCVTHGGIVAMRLERPWTMWLARADVLAWDGRPMGALVQRFSLLRRVLELESPTGEILARIEGPWWRPWTFLVMREGVEVGAIRKRWGGFAREAFTDADRFSLEMSPALTCPRTRQLLLAATLLVDLMWFENRGQRRARFSSSFSSG